MLLCDLILSNTLRKAMPRLTTNQELVFYKDGHCRVVEKDWFGFVPRTSRFARRKRRH